MKTMTSRCLPFKDERLVTQPKRREGISKEIDVQYISNMCLWDMVLCVERKVFYLFFLG